MSTLPEGLTFIGPAKLPRVEISVHSWVANVARLVPDVVFSPGASKRDGKTRVRLHYGGEIYEAVIEDVSPEQVRDILITPFDPAERLPCPTCGGELIAQPNLKYTLVFIECQGDCKCAYTVPLKARRP